MISWLIVILIFWAFFLIVIAVRPKSLSPSSDHMDELEGMPFPIRPLTQVEQIIDDNGPAMRPYDYWRGIWCRTGDMEALRQMERFVEWHQS